MDIEMPGINGIEAVKRVRASDSKVQIIMLTVFEDNKHVFNAICAGASGYLLKKHISNHLQDAIQQVMLGEPPMSPGIARIIISGIQQTSNQTTSNGYRLTNREKEILTLLSQGKSFKLIAANLTISIDTVRVHIKNIYEKLQVHTQTEAVSKALNEGLVHETRSITLHYQSPNRKQSTVSQSVVPAIQENRTITSYYITNIFY